MKVMETKSGRRNIVWKAIPSAFLAAALALTIAGCNSPKYGDSKDAVNSALNSNHLGGINVSQDRDKGMMTLTGTVQDQGQKTQAESVAKQAAPSYTIADQIAVVPPTNAQTTAAGTKDANADIDRAIEDNIKAALKEHRYFANDDIDVTSTNGSVTLTGTAGQQFDKNKAEEFAKKVPNVQQVINEIAVKHDR
jgi:hyperosmotically inducible protein